MSTNCIFLINKSGGIYFSPVFVQKTIAYTKRKHFIENSTRYKLKKDLLNLEALPSERLTPSQTAHYNFLKEKLKIFEEKLIAGYRQRTRGLPKYEQREPDIEFYAKLEKRSAQRTVIGELRDKNGDVYADNPNLIHIVTDFYTELYNPLPCGCICTGENY